MSHRRTSRVSELLADTTSEPRERFEYDGEIPSLDELAVETVERGERLPTYGDDGEL